MLARSQYCLLAAALLLVLGFARRHGQFLEIVRQTWQQKHAGADPPEGGWRPAPLPQEPSSGNKLSSFREIGTKYGTDKVSTHNYWFMYDKYLEPLRTRKLKMLEIGLGCDMNYGPGKSFYTWLEYLPNVELYYIEYDAACAEKWSAKTQAVKVYTGDQADKGFLNNFINETGGNYDIIIDDGGHKMNQQRVSFEELWKAVRHGGMYFCEDLQTSFMPSYGGDGSGGKDSNVKTMAKFIYELVDDIMTDGGRHAVSKSIRSIDCMREICAFTKKDDATERGLGME